MSPRSQNGSAQPGLRPRRSPRTAGTCHFVSATPPTEVLADFRDYYGPTMNAYAAAGADDRASDLQAELEQLFAAQNVSDDPDTTDLPAVYLRVEVSV